MRSPTTKQPLDFKRIEKILTEGVDGHYTEFKIRKSSGKYRKISSPDDELKVVQKEILAIIEPFFSRVISRESWGFVKGRNTLGHASLHRKVSWCGNGKMPVRGTQYKRKNKRPIFLDNVDRASKAHVTAVLADCVPRSAIRVDLKDAFGSIDKYALTAALIDLGSGFTTGIPTVMPGAHKVLTIAHGEPKFINISHLSNKEFYTKIAAICCYKGALPQGAPTSPLMLNIALTRFDTTVVAILATKFAKRYHLQFKYSRFADDMIVTCNKDGIAKRAIPIMEGICEMYGLRLNRKKTLIMSKRNGMFITGINVINGPFHMSTSRRNRNKIRAAIYQASIIPGSPKPDRVVQSIKGRIANIMSIDMAHGAKLLRYAEELGVLDQKDRVFGVNFPQIEELVRSTSDIRKKLWS